MIGPKLLFVLGSDKSFCSSVSRTVNSSPAWKVNVSGSARVGSQLPSFARTSRPSTSCCTTRVLMLKSRCTAMDSRRLPVSCCTPKRDARREWVSERRCERIVSSRTPRPSRVILCNVWSSCSKLFANRSIMPLDRPTGSGLVRSK